MVTKEGEREGKLRGMKEFTQEGSIDVKLPKGKCEIYSNVKIHTDDWVCSLPEALAADEKSITQAAG